LTEGLEKARVGALRDLDTHWEKLCAAIAPAGRAPGATPSRVALPSRRADSPVPALSVAIDPLRIEGTEAVAVARSEGEELPPAEVFFRFPADVADPAVLGDAFLLAFVFPAMQLGRDLHVRASVSPSLLEGLAEYQSVWACWKPAVYRRVRITADSVAERRPASARATLFGFSSGLDSSYTAWKLAREGRRAVGVLVQGYDIPMADRESGAALREAAAGTLASRGMELIPVATNWREAFATAKWDDAFGTMVATALTMVSGRFTDGLIAASDDIRRFTIPKGSYPAIDPLLGSRRFSIRQYGGDAPRLAKLAAVATWPEAFDALHVCWLYGLATNCGRCVRCLTLAAACAALRLPLPRSLPAEGFERKAFEGSDAVANRASFVEDVMRAASLTGVRNPGLDELAVVLDDWRSRMSAHGARQRLGDIVAGNRRAGGGRWSALANGVDRLMGSAAWRDHLRPAIRAIRSWK
jgi:hypothetical protein